MRFNVFGLNQAQSTDKVTATLALHEGNVRVAPTLYKY